MHRIMKITHKPPTLSKKTNEEIFIKKNELKDLSSTFGTLMWRMNNFTLSNTSRTITNLNTTTMRSTTASQNTETLTVYVAILLTNIFGAAANIILLLAMVRFPELRKSSGSALIMHCIIIDLYTTVVAVPSMIITSRIKAVYNLPESACKDQSLYLYIAYSATMYASCVVALHRLVATILPRHFSFLTKKSAIITMILLPWVVAFSINIFPALQIGVKIIKSPSGGCEVVAIKASSLLWSTVFGYYLPTGLIGISYVIVLGKTSYDVYHRRGSRSLRRRLEISRMLFVSFLWHCITIYPAAILVSVFLKEIIKHLQLQLAIKWLGSSFSAVNPVGVIFWYTFLPVFKKRIYVFMLYVFIICMKWFRL